MAQSAKPHKKIPAVRTFAADLDAMRNKAVMQAPTAAKSEAAPIKKHSAPHTEVAHVATTKKEPVTPSTAEVPPQVIHKNTSSEIPTAVIKPLPPLGLLTDKDTSSAAPVTLIGKDGKEIATNNVSSGVIITDTKKDRFQFFPAVLKSVQNWFAQHRTARKAKAIPKYAVPESSLRKGIIQKATSQTGRGTTSDFSSIQDRVRRRKSNDDSVPVPVVKKSQTTWSPNTEIGYPLLESGTVAVTNIKVVPKRSFINQSTESIPDTTPVIAPLGASVTPVVPTQATVVAEQAPTPTSPEVVVPTYTETESTANTATETVEMISENSSVAQSIADIPTPLITEEDLENASDTEVEVNEGPEDETPAPTGLFAISTNKLSIGVAGLILVVTIVGLGLYFYISNTTADKIIVTAPSKLVDLPMQATTIPSLNNAILVTSIATARDSLSAGGQVFIQSISDTEISAQDLIPALAFTLEPSFSQSITALRFGFTADNQPFLIVQVDNGIAARGGLLAWEASMASELSPFFSLTTSTSTATGFTDAIIDNNDIRLLKNSDGSTKIVYGIVGNKIIITTDIFNFSNLSQLLIK